MHRASPAVAEAPSAGAVHPTFSGKMKSHPPWLGYAQYFLGDEWLQMAMSLKEGAVGADCWSKPQYKYLQQEA